MTIRTFVRLSPLFGDYISLDADTPEQAAAKWAYLTAIGKRNHKAVIVRSCDVKEPESIGIKYIDKYLNQTSPSGFISGNVCSNTQSSVILPARDVFEVNGYKELDEGTKKNVPIYAGMLQRLAFNPIKKSLWNVPSDRQALEKIEHFIENELASDESVTLTRVMHLYPDTSRYDRPVPVMTHGWLLIGKHGVLHQSLLTQNSDLSKKMMDRATASLTNRRSNEVDLLRIEDGKIVLIHDSALSVLHSQGRNIDGITSHANVASAWSDESERGEGAAAEPSDAPG